MRRAIASCSAARSASSPRASRRMLRPGRPCSAAPAGCPAPHTSDGRSGLRAPARTAARSPAPPSAPATPTSSGVVVPRRAPWGRTPSGCLQPRHTSRIVSMTCACGCTSPSDAMPQCTFRSATIPRATNCSRTKSRARAIPSARDSSRGRAISTSRASCASLRRSPRSTSFHRVARSSRREGAPSGSRISECTTSCLWL